MLRQLTTMCLVIGSLIGTGIIAVNAEAGLFFLRPHNIRRITFFRPTLPAETELHTTVSAGSSLRLSGNRFGSESGSAFLVFGKVKLPVQIDDWQKTNVTVTLPPMILRDAMKVRVDVVTPAGRLAIRKSLWMTPPLEITNSGSD